MVQETQALTALCGAKKKQGEGTCGNTAGFKTDHVGEGKCYLHGGATPKRGVVVPYARGPNSLARQAEEMRQDPDLLDTEEQVALMKVIIRQQVGEYDEAIRRFYEEELPAWEALKARDPDTLEMPPKKPQPTDFVSHEGIRLLTLVQKTTLDVLFQKQNMLPKTEVSRIMAELSVVLQNVMRKYNLPQAAVEEFTDKVRSIQVRMAG